MRDIRLLVQLPEHRLHSASLQSEIFGQREPHQPSEGGGGGVLCAHERERRGHKPQLRCALGTDHRPRTPNFIGEPALQ